jgi:glycosyltransferase involved in cell wall biosynthesis
VELRPELAFLALGMDVTPRNPALAAALRPPLVEHCFLLGESDEVPLWLAAMDAHVLSSFSEGLSNAIGEAMAAGLPQIATAVGDNTIMVGDCGIIIPPADDDALVKAMLQIVDMGASGRERLGQKARQRIKDHFSPANNVQNYYEKYKQMIAKPGHNRKHR